MCKLKCKYYITFFTADIWTCHSRKHTGVTNNLNDDHDPETEAAKCNSAIINFIIFTRSATNNYFHC